VFAAVSVTNHALGVHDAHLAARLQRTLGLTSYVHDHALGVLAAHLAAARAELYRTGVSYCTAAVQQQQPCACPGPLAAIRMPFYMWQHRGGKPGKTDSQRSEFLSLLPLGFKESSWKEETRPQSSFLLPEFVDLIGVIFPPERRNSRARSGVSLRSGGSHRATTPLRSEGRSGVAQSSEPLPRTRFAGNVLHGATNQGLQQVTL
jgi:hypothetical protein